MDRDKSGVPIYISIADEIKSGIISGKYPPTTLLPSENRLRERFHASRDTVRKSLQLLVNEGFIYSRLGKGYFVASPQYGRYTLTISDEEKDSALRHVSVAAPSAEIAEALGISGKQKVIHLIWVVSKDGTPVACDIRYFPYESGKPTIESEINYAVFPEVAAAKTSAFAFHTHLELSVESACGRIVKYLNCKQGESLLVAKRLLIGMDGQRLGLGMKYMLPSYGPLQADSGILLDK